MVDKPKIVRSGLVNSANAAGVLRFAGSSGQFWSSRAYVLSSGALFLAFSSKIYLAYDTNYHRSDAFPLRCLSTVLGM